MNTGEETPTATEIVLSPELVAKVAKAGRLRQELKSTELHSAELLRIQSQLDRVSKEILDAILAQLHQGGRYASPPAHHR